MASGMCRRCKTCRAPTLTAIEMALSIGRASGCGFGVEDFARLGMELGVPQRATRRALIELSERSDRWLPDLDVVPFDRGKLDKLRA